jgi:transcriptional regulator with XRE-family HTH domain
MSSLRDWRLSQNLTLADVAARLRIEGVKPERTVQRFETGERAVALATALRIQEMTGGAVTPEDLGKTRTEWLREHGLLPAAEQAGAATA